MTRNTNKPQKAHPRPPRYRSRRLARRQASSPARRCLGRLLCLVRQHQDAREHAQGHLCRHHQHLRLPDAQPLEGDQAHPIPARGVLGCSPRGQALLGSLLLTGCHQKGNDLPRLRWQDSNSNNNKRGFEDARLPAGSCLCCIRGECVLCQIPKCKNGGRERSSRISTLLC